MGGCVTRRNHRAVPIAIGIIPGYKAGGGHLRDRGINHYKFVREAGAPACRQAGNQKL